MFFLLPALASVASAGAGLAGAAATTAAAAATSSGAATLAAAAGAGYALGSRGRGRQPKEQPDSSSEFDREAVRRELEAAYANGYDEAKRDVMDELKAIEYERGRKTARRTRRRGWKR